MNLKISCSIGFLLSLQFNSVIAQEAFVPSPASSEIHPSIQPVQSGVSSAAKKTHERHLTDEQLSANIVLFTQFLDQMVLAQQWEIVAHLLPLYAQLDAKDMTLLNYAGARIAHVRGSYPRAIEKYREILNVRSELTPVRMYLAQALFEDNQNEAAIFQFQKVQADNPPEPVLQMVAQYLLAIRQRSGWRVDGAVNYVSDNNVNNASSEKIISINGQPTSGTQSDDSLPKNGHGVNYAVNVARNFYITDQHAVTASADVNGKYYWDQRAYDDVIARMNIGYQWQTARKVFALVPFYQKRWFAGRAYSNTYGARLNGSYLIAPNWQVGAAYEYAENRYAERFFLNGAYHFVSASTNYTLNPKTQLFAGIDVMDDKNSSDASDSSLRVGYRAGVTRDFALNVSAQVQFGVAHKLYDAPNFFGVRRDEREYEGTLTLWSRGWYWYGVVPKLNFEYTRTQSNISMYSFQKNRVYLSLDRLF